MNRIEHVAPAPALTEKQLIEELDRCCVQLERWQRATAKEKKRAGSLLIQAKAKVPHGQWTAWVGRHFRFSLAKAERLMAQARAMQGKNPELMTVDEIDSVDQNRQVADFENGASQETSTTNNENAQKVVPAGTPAQPTTPPPQKQGREPGDDSDSEAAAKAQERRDRAKNGQPVFDMSNVARHLGGLRAEADKLAHVAGSERPGRRESDAPSVVSCPEHAGIVRRTEELKLDFERWKKIVVKNTKVKE